MGYALIHTNELGKMLLLTVISFLTVMLFSPGNMEKTLEETKANLTETRNELEESREDLTMAMDDIDWLIETLSKYKYAFLPYKGNCQVL